MDNDIERDEEEEQGKEFEEEAEEDYDYLDYDYDNFEEVGYVITQPEVTTWVGSDGATLEGVVVNWPILGRSKNISVFNDDCPICFKPMTGSGKHQICCLPCGHIYGMSCINQWLQQTQSYKKCPQCKSLCTSKDVTLLYATRPCVAFNALPKVSTKRFPFTKQGFKAFKRYALRRLDDESGMRLDAARRQDFARQQRKMIFRRRYHLDAVHSKKYYRLADKFVCLDLSLGRRMWALGRRIEAYYASIDYVVQRYKEHMTRDKCKGMATEGLPRIPSESPSPTPSPLRI